MFERTLVKKHILIVKTSSMGDVIHTLPALTDAKRALPEAVFDWVIEKNFAQIPTWHPALGRVIEIEFRKWRKIPWQTFREGKWQQFYRNLTETTYDYVIDAQGLFKSALIAFSAKGKKFGLNGHSAREPLASFFYHHRMDVPKNLHAVQRLRQLFSCVLDYSCPQTPPDYGIAQKFSSLSHALQTQPYVVFLHGTTWETKLWPNNHWQKLAYLLGEKNLAIYVPWGNSEEKERAEEISVSHENAHVLPPMQLSELAELLANAKAVIAVDTGLAHLAAALAVPTITLYGPTNPHFTGTMGLQQSHLASQFSCAPCLQEKCTYKAAQSHTHPPCFAEITPERVLDYVKKAL